MLRAFRLTHLYLGIFIAPALIFFAFTGALQTFDLHEPSHNGGSYKPYAIIATLGQIHKKQTWQVPQRRGPRPGEGAASSPAGPGATPAAAPLASVDTTGTTTGDTAGTHHGGGAGHHRHDDGAPSADAGAQTGSSTPTPQTAAPAQAPATPRPPQKSHLPMKIFFLIVSIGLFVSTITGIYMAYKYNRSKLIVTALLIAGTVIPLLLLPF